MTNNSDEDSKNISSRPKPVVLLLLDGWGVAAKSEANAISLAKMPNTLQLAKEYPALVLFADHGNLNTRYLSLGSGYFYENESDALFNLDLSALVSINNLKQLKIFDGERMAALSYFFNGRREEKLSKEEWIIISATDKQKTFDPLLSFEKTIKSIIKAVKDESHDFIVASSSLLDYLAATGNLIETMKAAEAIDKLLKRLANEVLASGGVLLISSAHGNAEKMKNLATDLEDREMTNNPVPLIFVSEELSGKTISHYDAPDGDLSLLKPAGNLSDLAPTIAHLLQLEKAEFSGQSLILFKQPETN
jgi:bisphosphoglycerate-independent phosphoglycerate mutase (AlkP superfamily)